MARSAFLFVDRDASLFGASHGFASGSATTGLLLSALAFVFVLSFPAYLPRSLALIVRANSGLLCKSCKVTPPPSEGQLTSSPISNIAFSSGESLKAAA
jgi:hypothetical protein